ncbi:hypothetical protein [Asticcacaulis sp. AC402]|uniref:hypothetical protein n=1 Tax=Asticcacaulis sp. AC402 TaxID=1282361 RepID=UPI0003C3E01C|nr:hypothetical protein [Asticcacaulis sp. AC402]ESQ73450.1 hypothetical protein ABAC402_19190 [Asticcacaulis sp. AC402]
MDTFGIDEAAATFQVTVERLAEPELNVALDRLNQSFNIDLSKLFPWETPGEKRGVRRGDGWSLIDEFVGDQSCLLHGGGTRIVRAFESGKDLGLVLANTPGFETYVFDAEVAYLICHNHHDALIGWGAASVWVQNLPENLS